MTEIVQRIRLNDKCPWPERIGCEGYLVQPTEVEAKVYPWAGLGTNEVIVLLDDDPLDIHGRAVRGWSCVVSKATIERWGEGDGREDHA
jgi:hypothetical protein